MNNNEEKKLIDKINDFMGKNYITLLSVFFTIQVVLFLVALFLRVGNLVLGLISFGFVLMVYLLYKENAAENQRKLSLMLFKSSMTILLLYFINVVIIALESKIPNADGSSPLLKLSLLFTVFGVLVVFSIFKNPKVKEGLDKIEENSINQMFNIKKEVFEPKEGDIRLCKNKESGEYVYLPYKDRFLHMLILGPTGSGKTSQTIIPMLLQDVQNMNAGVTVIEPKGDLAEKVYAMAHYYGRDVMYFNPILPDCPYFNPLVGEESDVIENMSTTFKMLNPDSPQFFLDMMDNLVRNSLKVLKRSMGNDCTLIDLHRLISNVNNEGKRIVTSFARMNAETEELQAENSDVASYFLNDYFAEKSKTFEHCSGLRSQVGKITSNKYLRQVLNPPAGRNDIDFDSHLANGGIIAIATAQGTLRDLGRYLGFFIILQFQASVFRRPGNENTRRPHYLYIDEFQVYANPGFADMLTQGRSYRVASHLATQNRALIGMGQGQTGKDFIELVSTNARNVIIYPAGNVQDAEYYSRQFGTVIKKETQIGISRKKWNPLYGLPEMAQPTETIRDVEEEVPRFTSNDIIYRPFGEIVYLIIQNNSVQAPDVGTIEYIPREINEELDRMILEYNEEQLNKSLSMGRGNPKEEVFDETTVVEKIHQVPRTPAQGIVRDMPQQPKKQFVSFDDDEFVDDDTHVVKNERLDAYAKDSRDKELDARVSYREDDAQEDYYQYERNKGSNDAEDFMRSAPPMHDPLYDDDILL